MSFLKLLAVVNRLSCGYWLVMAVINTIEVNSVKDYVIK